MLDAVGKTSKSVAKKVLKKNGRFVSTKMMTSEQTDLLLEIRQMADSGFIEPFVDKTFSLEQIVEAHQYVDTGRKRGNVVIKITD